MELEFRILVGIIYFFQMALLIRFYKKTNDKSVLHDSAIETSSLVIIRSVWAVAVIGSISLYIISPSVLYWGDLNLSSSVRVVGIFIGFASDLFILWVLVSLGGNISAALKVRDNQHLVTNGPYRFIRHPLYTAGILLFFSISLVSSNWFLGLIGIGFQLFIMYVRTPLEEKMLIEHFGDEYRSYMRKTGAYFPKIRINIKDS